MFNSLSLFIEEAFATIYFMQEKKVKKVKAPKEKKNSVFTLQISGRRDKSICGSLEFLVSHFEYLLKSGNEKNTKIEVKPATIKSLINNVNKVYAQREKASYYPTKITLLEEIPIILEDHSTPPLFLH